MDTDEDAPEQAVTVDNIFAALNAALGTAPTERNSAQLKLQEYEKDAVPGFLLSLLTICQQGGAVNEAMSLSCTYILHGALRSLERINNRGQKLSVFPSYTDWSYSNTAAYTAPSLCKLVCVVQCCDGPEGPVSCVRCLIATG